MKKLRFLLLLCVPLLFVILTGCGARVDTDMTFDTEFAGSRVMTLTIQKDDLSDIKGGIAALETVIKDNLPADLTYTLVADKSGAQVITFTMEFTDLEDYRTKVQNLIDAGITDAERENENFIVPEVIYEHEESYFKEGTKFNENFNSVDLLDWFREGIREAKIITQSESDWYEFGNSKIVIDGEEFSSSSSLNMNTQDNTCLSSAVIETHVLQNGTFERTVSLFATQEIQTKLADKGCELETYLKDLTPEGATFETVLPENADSYYSSTEYKFSFTASSADDLLAKTNAILQTEGSAFTYESTLDTTRPGYAMIALDMSFDGSFYFEYGNWSSPVSHKLYMYDGATRYYANYDGSVSYDYYDSEYYEDYFNSSLDPESYTFESRINFASFTLDIEPNGLDKVDVTITASPMSGIPADQQQSAIDRIKGFCEGDVCTVDENNVLTVRYSGTIEEVSAKINTMVTNATNEPTLQDVVAAQAPAEDEETGDDVAEDEAVAYDYDYYADDYYYEDDYVSDEPTVYFAITTTEINTGSLFTNGTLSKVEFDFSPLFGDVQMTVENRDAFGGSKYYAGYDMTVSADGTTCSSDSFIDITETSLNYLGIGLFAGAILFLLAGILLIVLDIKTLIAFIKALAEKAAQNKAAKQAQLQAQMQAMQTQMPQTPVMPQMPVEQQAVAAPVPAPVEAPAPAPAVQEAPAPAPEVQEAPVEQAAQPEAPVAQEEAAAPAYEEEEML